ncbi:MAG: L-serine ammonia-lyase, iron-sulfur-dependent, subunit alpha [Acidobacteriota bacterium]
MSIPSIFNDVLGPVMRGPSSSHSAAALRIGRLARDLMGGRLDRAVVDYDPSGSLVTTHDSQGSDLGLTGGLLGWEPHDPRLARYRDEARDAGLEIDVRYLDYGAEHPNTYRLTLANEDETRHLTAISTGGGMIEVQAVDGVPVALGGDLYEAFVFTDGDSEIDLEAIVHEHGLVAGQIHATDSGVVVHWRSRVPIPAAVRALVAGDLRLFEPVLPVLANTDAELPFRGADAFLDLVGEDGGSDPLWAWALRYEACRAGWSESEVLERAHDVLAILRTSVERGLEGREIEDRLLPTQVRGFLDSQRQDRLIPSDVHNRMILYVTAIMEAKSSMETIVAAPTAGSCATMPGALLAVGATCGQDDEALAKALLVAGMIGLFITEGATFSAELGGCMAECGSGSAMAAAGIAEMMGATPTVALSAASLALQNTFGMTCDPIANRVEAPCLGKNAMAAGNAINSVNMALAGYQHVVPLDEVIVAMNEVAQAMPRELRCTSLGGLSVTPTSKRLEAMLCRKPGC